MTVGSFSPDGKWALSANSDATVRVWALVKLEMSKHVFDLEKELVLHVWQSMVAWMDNWYTTNE